MHAWPETPIISAGEGGGGGGGGMYVPINEFQGLFGMDGAAYREDAAGMMIRGSSGSFHSSTHKIDDFGTSWEGRGRSGSGECDGGVFFGGAEWDRLYFVMMRRYFF